MHPQGKQGPGDAPTRERYDGIVRQHVLASTDPTRRPLGETKLRDVTVDRVAVWSQGNEQALACIIHERVLRVVPAPLFTQPSPRRRAAQLELRPSPPGGEGIVMTPSPSERERVG